MVGVTREGEKVQLVPLLFKREKVRMKRESPPVSVQEGKNKKVGVGKFERAVFKNSIQKWFPLKSLSLLLLCFFITFFFPFTSS
jgi:hypothetical protein